VVQGYFPQGVQRLAAPHVAQPHTARSSPATNGGAVLLRTPLASLCRGAGQPLPGAILQRMESAFGASFRDVRVHVGGEPAAIGTVAFTHGSHIHIAPGHYNPDTIEGRQVLGRELAHVVQQRAGRVSNPFGSGVAVVRDARLEAEAERMAHRAAGAIQPKVAAAHRSMQRIAMPHGGHRIQLKSNGRTIGSVDVTPRGQSEVVITNLGVVQEHRRQGSGRELMNAAVQLAQSRGVARVVLEARPADSSISQPALTAMYARMGFQAVGRSHQGNPIMHRTLAGAVQQPKLRTPPPARARTNIRAALPRHPKAVAQGMFTKGSSVGGELDTAEYNSGWATYASIYVDNGAHNLAVGGKTKSYKITGDEKSHAEDWMIDTMIPSLGVAPGATLILTVSRSPCTSTSRKGLPVTSTKVTGCTERLIGIAGTYTIQLIVKGLYGTNTAERAASVLALEAMTAAGINVSADIRNESPGVAILLSTLP
jgi:ribosomal protein S18 acetylase RimI-like enzyme